MDPAMNIVRLSCYSVELPLGPSGYTCPVGVISRSCNPLWSRLRPRTDRRDLGKPVRSAAITSTALRPVCRQRFGAGGFSSERAHPDADALERAMDRALSDQMAGKAVIDAACGI